MRAFIAFTGLLLVVKFVENISGEEIVADLGRSAILASPYFYYEHLQQCTAKFKVVTHNIYPKSNSSFHNTGFEHRCRFSVNTDKFDNGGKWIINTIWGSSHDGNYTERSLQTIHALRIHKKENVIPSNKISGIDGDYASIHLENNFDNVTKYYLKSNHRSVHITCVLGKNGNCTSAGLKMYGKYEVRMPINSNWNYSWTLFQESGDFKFRSGTFEINVVPRPQPEKQYKYWSLGSNEKIELPLASIQYCKLERPDGQIISLEQSECAYNVEKVSYWHSGVWKARYVPDSNMYDVEQEIIVKVVDPRAINVTVTTTKDKMIHMLCKTYVPFIDHCLFTMPNGTVINLLAGVGNDKYSYFGLGFQYSQSNYAECGLTIRQPSSSDYGLWTCGIKVKSSPELISAFVSISNQAEQKVGPPSVSTSNVYVKRGDNFTIKCTTSKSLEYCWLQSPNGTNYSVTKSRTNSINSLPYVGEGLSVGVCGATIENADDTHTGDWSCRLGVVGSAEIASIVPVTVTDSYIFPVQKKIDIADNAPKIVVRILPDIDVTIQYCRWVRPNGHGFYEKDNAQYLRTHNDSSCTLLLNDWSVADVGTWYCYARLSTDSDEEIHTTIELVSKAQNASNITLNIVIACLLSTIVLGSTIFFIFLYRKRMALVQTPLSSFNELDVSKYYLPAMNEKSNS